MKKLLITIPIIFLTYAVKGQFEYLKYPSYDTVISLFYNNYSVQNTPDNCELHFEKRPTGWHVTLVEYPPSIKTIKDELFWDKKSNKFRIIAFDKIKFAGENATKIEEIRGVWSNKYYYFNPYWGYPDWSQDIIRDYKDAETLPDSIMYSLGRAYSSYASNFLIDDFGRESSKTLFDLPQGKNCMNKKQLEQYRYYRHCAIETFKKVYEINPAFETIVGPIDIKTSNEYVTAFLDMRVFQNEQEAKNEIIEGLYNDFYISLAKNYLNSCAPNAILFTNGDNDTYPLLYLQSQYGFRTDVTVINCSLLNIDRYVESFREQNAGSPFVAMSLTPDEIHYDQRSVIFIKNDYERLLELKELIDFVKNKENIMKYRGSDYYYVPTNNFQLTHEADTMNWTIEKRYFGRNALIIMDIVSENNWQRPVYFTSSSTSIGFDEYLWMEGLTFSVNSKKGDTAIYKNNCIKTDVLYSNLMTKFEWKGINKITYDKDFCLYYRHLFYQLADVLVNKNELDSAKSVLDKCILTIPNELVYYDFWTVPIIECYYRLKDFNAGNAIAKELIYNLKFNINNVEGPQNVIKDDYRNREALMKLEELAKEFEQTEIMKLLE